MLGALEAVDLKLIRAEEHIGLIRDIVWEYLEREPSVVTKQSEHNYELKFIESPPDAISILAGEVIYQIRSALDHFAFELVKLNRSGLPLPLDWDEKCAFPLWLDAPKRAAVFNCFDRTLPGITTEAFTFIEAIQPYNRTDIGVFLGRMAALSNIDKHRHLHVLKAQAHHTVKGEVVYRGQVMLIDGLTRVENSAQINSSFGPNVKEVNVSRGFMPFVSFDEPTLDPGVKALPVEGLLEEGLNLLKRTIIPAFQKLIKNP